MPDLSEMLKRQASQNAEDQRRARESRIARGEVWEDEMQTHLRLAEQDRLEGIARANREAAEAEQKRAEDDREIALAQQAERHQAQYDDLYKQMESIVWATKLQNPEIPMGPNVRDIIVNELESMQVPEVSQGSILAAYERLFARGVLTPDYSRSARTKAIEEAEKARSNGLPIPFEFEQDPETMSPEQAMAMQRRLQPVSVVQLRALTEKLQDYAEYKERKKSPAGKGTRRASGL
jgi:hypothetical protein